LLYYFHLLNRGKNEKLKNDKKEVEKCVDNLKKCFERYKDSGVKLCGLKPYMKKEC
jgi:hypothetical protein